MVSPAKIVKLTSMIVHHPLCVTVVFVKMVSTTSLVFVTMDSLEDSAIQILMTVRVSSCKSKYSFGDIV